MSLDSIEELHSAAKPRRPWRQRFRIPLAIATLIGWILVTASDPFRAAKPAGFLDALTYAPAYSILFAGIFLVIVIVVFRWWDVGLNRPTSWATLRLLWLPAIYLVLFFLADAAIGLPSPKITGFLLLNTIFAGFSEELMFRGVLFSALRTKLSLGWAAVIVTVLFGLAHLLNAIVIGSIQVAAAQATAATVTGVVFIAIRVRTGSLLPAMVYHTLWDFGLVIAVVGAVNKVSAAATASGDAPATGMPSPSDLNFASIGLLAALLLPNFLYALFLLRRAGRANAATTTVAA